jgi:NADPH:quinone reductase
VKAILCKSFAPVGALTLEDVEDPEPTSDTLVIDVAASGVNFVDGLIVQGKYQTKPPFPFSPGSEVAGTVRAIGDETARFKPGDRVVSFCRIGGYAEAVRARTDHCFALPPGVHFVAAAGFLIAYGTSYHALKYRACLEPGETLLVLGAAGGVGLAAVELGHLIGARVIAAASSEEKLALSRAYGADELINYSSCNLRDEVKRITGGRGIDVVYDPVGGPLAEEALRCLGWMGRYLVIGFAAGEIPRFAANQLLLRNADVRGLYWGESLQRDPIGGARNMAELLDLLAQGRLKPHISEIHPLERAVEALERVMRRDTKGKVILTVDQRATI